MKPQGIGEAQRIIRIQELMKKLPQRVSSNSATAQDTLVRTLPQNILDEVTDVISNYIDEKAWGALTKITFDRALKYYERERYPARNLVKVKNIDTDFYQWLVSSAFTASLRAIGSQLKTNTLQISSRVARIREAGMMLEMPLEQRDLITPDLLNEAMNKVVDAFDELETHYIFASLMAAVPDGTKFKGVKFSSHVLDANKYTTEPGVLNHEKMLDLLYLLEEEGFKPTTMVVSRKLYYKLLNLDPFKDANQNWTTALVPKAVSIIQGDAPGKPILPGTSIMEIATSGLIPSGPNDKEQVVLYDKSEYFEYLIREPLNASPMQRDYSKNVDRIYYRMRFGGVAKEPVAAVKMINLEGVDISSYFA